MKRTIIATTGAAIVALGLAGCVANNPTSSGSELNVRITDTACEVSSATAASGAIKFTVTNNGSDVNEFEILAADKLRIVGEKENITPGQTVSYVAQLDPGSYYTACKLGMVGDPMGIAAFTVTGQAAAASADEQAAIDQAVENYVDYVKDQTGDLVTGVKDFTAAYAAGDDAKARALFPTTRVYYERIEPTAEAFGELDPAIDFREPDATEEGIPFTGFHRIEKDLWPPAGYTPSDAATRQQLATDLNSSVQKLYDLVYSANFEVSLADISNGAIGLLDEVSKSKITGEEDAYSHTDLWDFKANVDGASVAYGIVRDIAASKGDAGSTLITKIDSQFDAMNALLATYGSTDKGFVLYDTLTPTQVKALSDQLNALSEPLSELTHTVLGVETPKD